MSKPGKKPAPATPAAPAARPGAPQAHAKGRINARQQPDNRWRRTKRYGWDSR